MSESRESGNDIGQIVPFVQGDARADGLAQPISDGRPSRTVTRHDELVKIRCFELWGTLAARNCAHVERLLREELAGADVDIPSRRTIQEWAQNEQWAKQADTEWRSTADWTVEQMRALVLANALLAEKNRHDVQLGLYEGREMHAVTLLKAGELADRKQERLMPLSSLKPPAEVKADQALTREEDEALARKALVRRKKEAGGYAGGNVR